MNFYLLVRASQLECVFAVPRPQHLQSQQPHLSRVGILKLDQLEVLLVSDGYAGGTDDAVQRLEDGLHQLAQPQLHVALGHDGLDQVNLLALPGAHRQDLIVDLLMEVGCFDVIE